MILHLFMHIEGGGTLTFHGVTNFFTNETYVTFDYAAKSDGNTKHATFLVDALSGWSWCNE